MDTYGSPMEHPAINRLTTREHRAHIWLDAGFSLPPGSPRRRMAGGVNN